MAKNHRLFRMYIMLIISLAFFIVLSPVKKAEAMSNDYEPYLGQISLFPYGWAPMGWTKCTGQTLSIAENQELNSLLGTNFGGDGQTTFALPNLNNASPLPGADYYIATEGIFPSAGSSSFEGYLGEIGLFPYNFTPGGWSYCNGDVLPISQNTTLFSLIGIMFGGDGKATFALPNLSNCAPLPGLHYCISLNGIFPSDYYSESSNGFLGAIGLFPNNYKATDSSGLCNGQSMNINQNAALRSLIGIRFGGDESTTYALPDLRGATPDPHLRYIMQTQGNYPSRP